MTMIDVEKFVASLIEYYRAYYKDSTSIKCWLDDALEEQGLEYKDGEIVKTQRRVAAEAKEAIFDDDFGDYINELSKQFPEVSFAKLSRIAVRVKNWLEKQTNKMPEECVYRPLAGCDINSAAKQAIEQQGVLAKKIVLAFNGAYIPVKGKNSDDIVNEYNAWLEKQKDHEAELEKAYKTADEVQYRRGYEDAKRELEMQGEKKSDICDGCNNIKGCVTCTNGDQWAHYSEVKE